ncbi:MAG TPA: hypothetical protein VGD77_08200 [Gemmatimonadaceae bacterium]
MKRASEAWAETGHSPRVPRSDVALWLSFLGGPVVALGYELLVYALVPLACHRQATWFMHLASLGAFAAVLVALGGCARAWRREGEQLPHMHDAPHPGARRLLGVVGLMLGVLSLLAVGAQWLAILLESPCKL